MLDDDDDHSCCYLCCALARITLQSDASSTGQMTHDHHQYKYIVDASWSKNKIEYNKKKNIFDKNAIKRFAK